MMDKIQPPELSFTKSPPVGFHFQVTFLIGGIVPNLLDIRFQKVSGISSEVEIEELKEGGQNLFTHRLPNGIKYGNLVLERGMVIGSPLNVEFNVAMSTFTFFPSNVLVSLLDEGSVPISNWVFVHAYPVKWSVSDLDANNNAIVIDTMELAYEKFISIRI